MSLWSRHDVYLKYLSPLFQWHACKLAKLSAFVAKCVPTINKISFFKKRSARNSPPSLGMHDCLLRSFLLHDGLFLKKQVNTYVLICICYRYQNCSQPGWSQKKLPLAIPLFSSFLLRDISPSRNHSSFSIDFCDTVVHVMYALHSNQCLKNQNREKQVFIFNNSQSKTKFKRTTVTYCHRSLHVFSQSVFMKNGSYLRSVWAKLL